MDEFANYRLCTNGAGQYVNNLMTSNGHVPVSTFNYNIASPSERKRQSDQMAEHYIESDNTNKKSRCDLSYSSAPSAIDSENSQNRLESLILQLSANFTSMSKSLEKRIDDLETNMEEKISVKVSERISTMIDNKLKEKIDEVKTEVKNELDVMKSQINSLEKKVSDKDTNSSRQSNTRNRFIIKNLSFDERELTEDELTKHKVKGLLRDGLGLANVDIKSVHRKESRGVYPGIVVVETSNMENKKEVMKNKSKLKSSRQFEKVYIENDMPLETRNFQNAMRTVLKEMGKDKDYKFAGSRLLAKTQ
ncbi:unnamed protein product [Mytilus coruscus]|uniref:Uncharacterized protein n=1 Tax=Mytilus coruscus TaxID=42192 RepID=A0A6J8CG02_MYTCO|nr:unnamed protein product [Mytilus coruscus]